MIGYKSYSFATVELVMDEDYKLAKEAFVVGLQGTSAREVFLVFAIAPVRCFAVALAVEWSSTAENSSRETLKCDVVTSFSGEFMALLGAYVAARGRGHPTSGCR